jgi:hypothetical protein
MDVMEEQPENVFENPLSETRVLWSNNPAGMEPKDVQPLKVPKKPALDNRVLLSNKPEGIDVTEEHPENVL